MPVKSLKIVRSDCTHHNSSFLFRCLEAAMAKLGRSVDEFQCYLFTIFATEVHQQGLQQHKKIETSACTHQAHTHTHIYTPVNEERYTFPPPPFRSFKASLHAVQKFTSTMCIYFVHQVTSHITPNPLSFMRSRLLLEVYIVLSTETVTVDIVVLGLLMYLMYIHRQTQRNEQSPF